MITVQVANQYVEYSGLSWSSSDPGGFEACSFVVDRSAVANIDPGDNIYIYDGPTLVWHGLVEEPGLRSTGSKETYNVAGAGYASVLKTATHSMIYVDRDLSQFKQSPSLDYIIQLADNGNPQGGSFEVATGEATDGKPSMILSWTELSSNGTTRVPVLSCWYDAGLGNTIDYVRFQYETYDKGAGGKNLMTFGTWLAQVYTANTDLWTVNPTDADITNMAASSGTIQHQTEDIDRRWVAFWFYFPGSSTATGDWKWIIESLRIIGRHGIPLRNFTGYYPSDIAEDAMRNSLTGFDVQIDPAVGYIIPHIVYREPTPIETILTDAAKFVGWHWGVWEPQNMMAERPCMYFCAPPSMPTAFVDYGQCTDVDITEKFSEMFNSALVHYSIPNGTSGHVTIFKSHPRLPDSTIRTVDIDAGVVGTADVAETIGLYQLSLLQDNSRTAGSMTLPKRLYNGKPAHLLRPGLDKLRILGLPNQERILVDHSAGVDNFRVRRVSVTVDNDNPVTNIEFDHGADLIEVMQARLATDVAAKNLGGG